MERSTPRPRVLFGGFIALLGVLLEAIVVYDIYIDVVVEKNASYTTIVENSVPLVLAGLIIGSAVWMVRNENVEVSRHAALWSGACMAGLLFVSLWMYAIQFFQGQIEPMTLLAHVGSVGVLAGIFLGIYSGRHSHRERQLEALFENSGDAIAEISFEDEQPIIQNVNPQFERTFGHAGEEIQGTSIDDVIVEPAQCESAVELSQRAHSGEQYDTTVERNTADGETRIFRLQAIPISTGSRETDGYAVYTDITASQRFTERVNALHQATRELVRVGTPEEVASRGVEAVANTLELPLPGIFFEADSELQVVAISDNADEILGEVGPLERGTSIAWEVYESGQPRNIGDLSELESVQNPETPIGAEMIIPLADYGVLLIGDTEPGEFSEAEFTLAQILGGNIVTALDRVTREEELRVREQELAQQNQRLDLFSSVVSHDLRNPLSVATGYLELARENPEDTESLDQVAESLDRMDTMIEELLTLARNGNSALSPERVEFETIVNDAWDTTETGNATLTIAGGRSFTADRNRIQQLLENLFRNAVNHGGDEVAVTVGPIDEHGFFVADTGPGIPADNRDEVFDHGYTTSKDGSGFGLTIVKEIVDSHGGTVLVTESESGGAQFEIRQISVDKSTSTP